MLAGTTRVVPNATVCGDDLDHEPLYSRAHDGFEDHEYGVGMAPMDFASWFDPFNEASTMPPYVYPDTPRPPTLPAPVAVLLEACGDD